MDNTTIDYADIASSWNSLETEPWCIRSIYSSSEGVCIVVQRKELQHELLDWFEDMRVSGVVRGDKILSRDDFWRVLYKELIPKLQQLFKPVTVRITEKPSSPCVNLLWGAKINIQVYPAGARESSPNRRRHKNFHKY